MNIKEIEKAMGPIVEQAAHNAAMWEEGVTPMFRVYDSGTFVKIHREQETLKKFIAWTMEKGILVQPAHQTIFFYVFKITPETIPLCLRVHESWGY